MATPCSAASPPRIPSRNFIPDYGRITAYRGATGFGIPARWRHRLFRRGDHPLLRPAPGKDHRLGADAAGGDRPLDRALREFRIRGVATNLTFLEAIIGHEKFRDNTYTTRFIDTTPELFTAVKRQGTAPPSS